MTKRAEVSTSAFPDAATLVRPSVARRGCSATGCDTPTRPLERLTGENGHSPVPRPDFDERWDCPVCDLLARPGRPISPILNLIVDRVMKGETFWEVLGG